MSQGLGTLAHLDAIFFRVAYGLNWGGNITYIGTDGRLHVTGIAPPVLTLRWDANREEC
jgi:hypothetical protein